MKQPKVSAVLLALLGSVIAVSFIGCGNNGSSNVASSRIDAQTTIAGVLQAWTGASLSGEAFGASCDPGTDTNCVTEFSGAGTDSSGHYVLYSDAIPGDWGIAGAADSECSTGASFYGQISSGVDTPLTCGQINPSFPAVSPSHCQKTTFFNLDTGKIVDVINDCPATVTLTESSPTFPTSYALSVIGYDDTGTQVASNSVNATSSTEIIMPTPTQPGYSVLVIRDPTNNNVLGSSLFNFIVATEDCHTNSKPYCPK